MCARLSCEVVEVKTLALATVGLRNMRRLSLILP